MDSEVVLCTIGPTSLCRRKLQDTPRAQQSHSCWKEAVSQSGDPVPDAPLLSPWTAKWREECLWEVDHFITPVALFAHLVVNLSGPREAASNPLCCCHCLALSPACQTVMSSGQDWASKSHLPLSPEEIEALVTVLNKTTSLVAPREVLAEVNTQAPGDHFQRSNCDSPIVKGGKCCLFYRKSSIMPDGQRCNRLLLCCPKTSPYESSGS